jgi:hypothetical protein
MGMVTIMLPVSFDWFETRDLDFHVIEKLEGFNVDAVNKNDAYHKEVAKLEHPDGPTE